jgi:peptidoglycan/LPS O-acetylase OafA/YrhL
LGLSNIHALALTETVPDAAPAHRRPQLPAITGLRFFLAAHVLLFHFQPAFFGASDFGRNLIRAGSSAVAGFFLLSGFILTYAHVETDHPAGRPLLNIGRERFWAARFLRIYPAYLVAFILAAPFAIVQLRVSHEPHGVLFAKTVAYLLMVQAWIPNLWHYWNYPAWSLSAEALFYALFPALVAMLLVRRSDDWLWLGSAWLAGLIAPLLLLGRPGYYWLLASPPSHLPEFVFGMLAGKLFITRHKDAAPTPAQWRWAGPIAAIAIILADGCGWFPPSLLDHGLLAPLLAILFFSLARDDSLMLAFFHWKPIVYLGEISYGIYILQFPIFTACFVVAKRIGIPWNTRATFVAVCAVLIIAASLSFELIETPVRRWGTSWFRESMQQIPHEPRTRS